MILNLSNALKLRPQFSALVPLRFQLPTPHQSGVFPPWPSQKNVYLYRAQTRHARGGVEPGSF
jgi:hypothetical protein